MKYLERGIVIIFACVIIFATHQGVASFMDVHNWRGLSTSDWAAWVQALGSIAAIGIALHVMTRQNAHSAKLVADADRRATLRRAHSVHAVLTRAHSQLNNIRRHLLVTPGSPAQVEKLRITAQNSVEVLEALEVMMKSIPAYDLGSYEMAEGLMQFTELISTYRATVAAVAAHPIQAGQHSTIKTVQRMHEIFDEATKKFDGGMKTLQ